MVLGREKSVVRFQRGSSPDKRSNSLLQARQKSEIRNRHRYAPRLHRQQTEQPPVSLLGAALKTVAESNRCDDDFYSLGRSAARDELKDIVDKVFVSMSRNSFGVQFLEPIHLLGFAHWQSHPEKKVICFLPIHIPKLHIQTSDPGSVFITLPKRFQSHVSLHPSDLLSPHTSGRYLSSKKLFSLVIKQMIRVLGIKSVSLDRIRSSEKDGILEIDLMDNEGWTGQVVLCLAIDKLDSLCYCRKPFYNPLDYVQTYENIEIEIDNADTKDPIENTPRSIASIRSNSKQYVRSKFSGGTESIDFGDDVTSKSSLFKGQGSMGTNDTNGNRDDQLDATSACPDDNESDVTWYACQPKSENNLVHSISASDVGVRLTALLVVFKLLQHDWRLLPISCYQVQAAMLHETEHALDSSPRWQRNSLESCVKLLIRSLHYFARVECLPHFSVGTLDLWLYLTKKQLALAKSALERLSQSDTALLSLVRRAGRYGADLVQQEGVSGLLQPGFSPRPRLLKPIAP